MTPEQIKRAKRLAEILGLTMVNPELDCTLYFTGGIVGRFNPEQDKALLWDLMFEYKLIVRSDAISRKEAAAKIIDRVIAINGGYDEQS